MSVRKRVLIVSATTGYQLRAFDEAAGRLGVELAFATDRCHLLDDPWRDRAIPVRFYDEPSSVDAIVASAREAPIDAIVAVGDRPAVLAAVAAATLGLPGNPPAAARTSANKNLTRAALASAGLPSPWFETLPLSVDLTDLLARARFPCVVKPLELSGSRGVMRADSPQQLEDALARLRKLLDRPQVRAERNPAHERVLVEGYIPGREFAVEGLIDRGCFHSLAVFEKPDPLEGPFFEETIYVTPPDSAADGKLEALIVHTIGAAARAIGLQHGPVHAECRVNARGVYVLEVAARPIGGLCARALQFCDGDTLMSLEELILRHARGEAVDSRTRETAASAVMMIPVPRQGYLKGVEGLDAARDVSGISEIEITAKPDQMLQPLPEGASYLGFIFSRAATSREAVAAVREAHSRLTFRIDQPLLLSGT
ncbi:MAG TPA: ATP-grasp domain-containing protein [Vicinamibacterales bacterium]|jgi:biotin carboxylase|nr:ATP-grasp domain-containing protein [Vicinamibacterales bacterium]